MHACHVTNWCDVRALLSLFNFCECRYLLHSLLVLSTGKGSFAGAMSRSKDASSKLHEKHQTILADLLRDEDNKYCADCLSKGEYWCVMGLDAYFH